MANPTSSTGQPFIAEAHKKKVYIFAAVAIFSCAIIVGVVAGAIFGFIATVVFGAVVIGFSITLTETPDSAQRSFEKIKQTFGKIKIIFTLFKDKFAGLTGRVTSPSNGS
jgi:uncharacterized membrane protein required for colicin V production